ncbi:MAG: hypothetical protein EXQ85_09860 [Alphaproteobacteria bacterium]|nr:hypothetical protein [Alphaproteobacteria bacterium]
MTLIDARLQGDYLGVNKMEWARRYGTIPGAKNVPANWVTLDGRGRFRDLPSYLKLFEHLQIDPTRDIIVFGNGSQSGSLVWFVLAENVRNRQVRLYAAGMAEWAADLANPIERRISLD